MIRDAIGTSDALATQIDCVLRLVRLEPNPEPVQRFLVRASELIDRLEDEGRWHEIAPWLARQRELGAGFRDARPDVAEAITASLTAYCTVVRATRLVELAGRDADGRAAADAIVEALGPEIGPALLDALSAHVTETKDSGRAAVQLLCDHAKLVAPALVAGLKKEPTAVVTANARVFGLRNRARTTARDAPQP